MPDRMDGRRKQDRRPRRSTMVATAALVTLLVAAGCGGGDGDKAADNSTASSSTSSSSSTSTTADDSSTTLEDDGDAISPGGVCDLVTPVDIDAALQVTVEAGQQQSEQDNAAVCSFETADNGSTHVAVFLYEPVGNLLANTLAGDPSAEALSGVGDEAVKQLEIGQITMRVGETGVVITVVPTPTEAALVQLARTAAGRM